MPKIRPRNAHSRAHSRDTKRQILPNLVESLEQRLLMARLTGIDVSQFQGTMNWDTAASRGLSFAFIRGSRTDTVPDTQLANNMHPTNGAKAKGIVVGVYHRILPFSNVNDDGAFVDPIVDAQNFYNAAGAYMGTGYMRPVIDVENGSSLNSNPVNGYNLSSWVLAWVNRLKQLNGNITPTIYTGHYRTYLNSSVVSALPNLWIANWNETTYGDPVTGSGGPPISPWPSWKFWQYDTQEDVGEPGLGAFYGAQSSRIDLDVFNGDDINVLKQNFVTGAPNIPAGPSPANGATSVPPQNLLLNWNDSPGATRYDVYFDNNLVASNIGVSEYNIGTIAGGSHSWRVVAKGPSNDDDTWVTLKNNWTFTASNLPLPGVPSNPSPASGALLNSKPIMLDWDDAANASSYEVWSGTSLVATVGSSQFGPISPLDGVRPWHVVAKNPSGSTTGPAWSFTMDTVAPTASYGSETPTAGASFLDFTVTYTDATTAVDAATLDDGDVRVQGPNGFDAPVTMISVDLPGNGSPRTVTYRVAAPGGSWDGADNGTYNIVQQAGEVKDVAGTGNARPEGTIGSFNVDLASFAWMTGSTLNVQFDGTITPILLSTNGGGEITAMRDSTTLNFTGVADINAMGTALDDVLQIDAPVAPPLVFSNGDGDDVVHVVNGAYDFTSDLFAVSQNVAVIIASTASANFNASQHLRSLTVNGNATLTPGGGKVIVTKDLAVSGRLDLTDNDLIWDYEGDSPLGEWSGTSYTEALGMVQGGRGNGSWNGNGIVTSMTDATAGTLTTVGVSEASTVLGISGNETDLFSGQTVDATSILFKYTWGGDADMNGELNGDDYFVIDSFVAQSGSVFGYDRGDFNLDGLINGDDYFIIDSNIAMAQGLFL